MESVTHTHSRLDRAAKLDGSTAWKSENKGGEETDGEGLTSPSKPHSVPAVLPAYTLPPEDTAGGKASGAPVCSRQILCPDVSSKPYTYPSEDAV